VVHQVDDFAAQFKEVSFAGLQPVPGFGIEGGGVDAIEGVQRLIERHLSAFQHGDDEARFWIEALSPSIEGAGEFPPEGDDVQNEGQDGTLVPVFRGVGHQSAFFGLALEGEGEVHGSLTKRVM